MYIPINIIFLLIGFQFNIIRLSVSASLNIIYILLGIIHTGFRNRLTHNTVTIRKRANPFIYKRLRYIHMQKASNSLSISADIIMLNPCLITYIRLNSIDLSTCW